MKSVEEILATSQPTQKILCGVYFLICNGEIVYVGKSTDILSRINQHTKEGDGLRKQFDSFAWISVPFEKLYETEFEYMKALKPRLNGTLRHATCRRSDTKPKWLARVENTE